MGQRLGKILDGINEYEHAHDRPLVSALVVHATYRLPGEGFFKLAQRLGRIAGSDPETHAKFWLDEVENIRKTWAI